MNRFNKIYLVGATSLGLFLTSYLISYNMGSKDTDSYLVRDVPTQAVDAAQEIIVSNITKLTLESYDADSGSVTEERINMPVEYIGLTRYALLESLQDYMLNPSVSDKTKGILACELVEFTRTSVTIRKTYSSKNLPQHYVIMAEKGRLVIYLSDRRTLYDRTDIELSKLPYELQNMIINGMVIDSADALYDFLETFTS